MASSQADGRDERAAEAAEYAADQMSQARNMHDQESDKKPRGSDGGVLSSVLGAVTEKTGELKELLSEKKEAVKMKIPVAGECPREVLEETETEARRTMGDIRVKESGVVAEDHPAVEAAVRQMAAKEAAATRGVAAKANIVGTMGSVREAIRSKLSMPITDVVAESLASQRHGGSGRSTKAEKVDDVSTGNAPVGVVDSIKLKANDVAGQAKEAVTSKR